MSSSTAGATASHLEQASLTAGARLGTAPDRAVNASLLEHARLIATAGKDSDGDAALARIVIIGRRTPPVIGRKAS